MAHGIARVDVERMLVSRAPAAELAAAALKLTPAQREALEVLDGRGELEGWRRSTTVKPVPRVNFNAAGALVDKGLAKRIYPSGLSPVSAYVHEDSYLITDAGRLLLDELRNAEG